MRKDFFFVQPSIEELTNARYTVSVFTPGRYSFCLPLESFIQTVQSTEENNRERA